MEDEFFDTRIPLASDENLTESSVKHPMKWELLPWSSQEGGFALCM